MLYEALALGFEVVAYRAGKNSLCAGFQVVLHVSNSRGDAATIGANLGHHAYHSSCKLIHLYD